MALDIYNEIKRGGFVMLSYDLLPYLDAKLLIVLWQIIAELNHAVNNDLNINYDFLFSPQRMADFLGMDINELSSNLLKLQKLGFIYIFNPYIEDTTCLRVRVGNIIKYKQEANLKNHSRNWDDGLKVTQNPVHMNNTFSPSTLCIKNLIESRIRNPEKTPLIGYVHLDNAIREYEKNVGNPLELISDLDETIYKLTSTTDIDRYDIYDLSQKIYNLSIQSNATNEEEEIFELNDF